MLIDSAPTYDNLVLNAVVASDIIITPVRMMQFDYKGAMFFRDQIAVDTDKLHSWRLLLNCARRRRKESPESLRNQYESLFRSTFGKAVLPVIIPDSPHTGFVSNRSPARAI